MQKNPTGQPANRLTTRGARRSSTTVSLKIVVAALAATLPIALPSVAQAQANLVVNGDFSAVNTGFSTDYTPAPGDGTSNPPEYAVISNPKTAFPTINFASYGDHTTGTGLMLYADGASSSSSRVWYETLSLAANTTYTVSFWGANADLDKPGSPAILQFSAGATPVGPGLDLSSAAAGVWTEMTGTFDSGTGGNIVVSIADANTSGPDNDFTVDDIAVSANSSAAAPEPQSVALLSSLILAAFPVARFRAWKRSATR